MAAVVVASSVNVQHAHDPSRTSFDGKDRLEPNERTDPFRLAVKLRALDAREFPRRIDLKFDPLAAPRRPRPASAGRNGQRRLFGSLDRFLWGSQLAADTQQRLLYPGVEGDRIRLGRPPLVVVAAVDVLARARDVDDVGGGLRGWVAPHVEE
jgi:hypothetical protein